MIVATNNNIDSSRGNKMALRTSNPIRTMATWISLSLLLINCALINCETTWTEVNYDMIEEVIDTTVGNLGSDTPLNEKYGQDLSEVGFEFLKQQGQDYSEYFAIESSTGILQVVKSVDRDTLCPNSETCELKMDIGALGPDRDFLIIKITINVIDTNDNAPGFPDERIVIQISEASSADTYALPRASDPDSAAYAVQSYELLAMTNKFSLRVTNNTDGSFDLSLVLTERLDREEVSSYSLQVVAKDGGTPPLQATLAVEVVVQDANDNKPEFLNKSYQVTLREDVSPDTSFLKVQARDPDEGPSGQVVYGFTQQTHNQHGAMFSISNSTGDLTLLKKLDYEVTKLYLLQVIAFDKGPGSETSTVKLTVKVQDVNDHAPEITINALSSTGNVEVPENSDPGTFVAHVSVKDLDSSASGNGQLTCRLSDGPGDGPFNLEQIFQGVFQIATTKVLDRETQFEYIVNLECQDYGQPPLISNSEFVVTVLDENDHPPVFTRELYTLEIEENNAVNLPLMSVTATDSDTGDNAKIIYTIGAADVLPFINMVPDSGEIFGNMPFDYELVHMLQFPIIAKDSGDPSYSATASVVINVRDSNDEKPVFPFPSHDFTTFENQAPGTEIGVVQANDKDSEQPFKVIEYSFVQETPIFHIESHTGKITSLRMLDREALADSTYHLVVMAKNPGFQSMSSTVMVNVHVGDVNDNAPTILFPNPVNKTLEVPYMFPAGPVLSRVLAEDADIGDNAKLHYSIADGNDQGLFDIEHTTGAISVTKRVRSNFIGTHSLLIMVKDYGNPQKSATAHANFIVDEAVVYVGAESLDEAEEQTAGGLPTHQTILISLGIITVLLVAALITAIICVKRRQYKAHESSPGKLYSVDLSTSGSGSESEMVNNLSSEHTSINPSTKPDLRNGGLPDGKWNSKSPRNLDLNGGPGFHQGQNIQGTFVSRPTKLPCQDAHDDNSSPRQQQLYDPSSHPDHQVAPPHTVQIGAYACTGPPPRHRIIESPADVLNRPWALTQKELEVHQLLQRMTTPVEDEDSSSGCSMEGSNTDSGRGPSEDGEQPHDHDGHHVRNGRHRPQSRTGTPQRPSSTTPQYTVQYTHPNVAGIHPANHRPSHLHNTQMQPMEGQQAPPVLPPRGLSYSNGPYGKRSIPENSMVLQVPHRHHKRRPHSGDNHSSMVPVSYNSLSRCTDTTLGDSQDELSDGASTTSGSYTLDLEEEGSPRKLKTFADTFV